MCRQRPIERSQRARQTEEANKLKDERKDKKPRISSKVWVGDEQTPQHDQDNRVENVSNIPQPKKQAIGKQQNQKNQHQITWIQAPRLSMACTLMKYRKHDVVLGHLENKLEIFLDDRYPDGSLTFWGAL